MNVESEFLVHLARLGLSGRPQDVQAYLRRIIKKLSGNDQKLADALVDLLATNPTRNSPLRDAGAAMLPVDGDSRLALLRHEDPTSPIETPILSKNLQDRLDQVLAERRNLPALARRGLSPTRSILFVGPPGVGKTLCARWLAHELNYPLLVLDLSAVMSSYLGKTGSNLRNVLDYAKGIESVLLLDEFDAVAKRRDDDSEIGELKRLVTVLLQEIDDWPATNLLIAATNHGNLLDPAAWRRFDDILQFDLPPLELRTRLIKRAFAEDAKSIGPWISVLAEAISEGQSFSDIERLAQSIRRRSTIQNISLEEALFQTLRADKSAKLPLSQRRALAQQLQSAGLPEREISRITTMSRDTLRSMRRKKTNSQKASSRQRSG